jgi:NADPH:quinone reductase-like Zn-dependent oxidoreductase
MKAIRLHGRGGPEQLVCEDSPAPTLEAGDVLIRVHACSITRAELTWPPVHTAPDGSIRPFIIPGHEVSGVVEAVAPGVREVKAGDEVYALVGFDRVGGAAEYVAVRAADAAPKPCSLSHVEAAAVPLAGLTAWQALFHQAGLSEGQSVLIHGAAGGVGTYAVQLARLAGARVIGTALARDEGLLRELGADEVIDYTATRFEDEVADVDVVFDAVGGETLERSWRVLRRGGVLVTIASTGESNPPDRRAAEFGVRGVFFIVRPDRGQLIEIARLIDGGKVRPVIGSVFPLARAREAFGQGIGGGRPGKVVLRVVE